MGDLSGAIDALATGTYAVTRRSASTYAGGVVVPGSTTVFSVRAVAVPASGRDLQRLPEGMRTREVMRVFTREELRTAQAGQDPDLLAIEGYSWEVQNVKRWLASGGFHESLAVKVGSP